MYGLVIVDVQNDFVEGGVLGVAGSKEILPRIQDLAERFKSYGHIVLCTRDFHPLHTEHFKEFGGTWPPHCVQGTPGADLAIPDLKHDYLLSKGDTLIDGGYSAFEGSTQWGTTLEQIVMHEGIQALFFCGLATDYCVKASVLDSRQAGIRTYVVEDCIAAVNLNPDDGKEAIAEMRSALATFLDSDEIELY